MYIYIFLNYQLPPVIKNMAFQKFSNMEQSLFTRFVRLCVPTVELDAQGRARSRYELFKPRLILSSNPGTSQCLSPGGREWKSFGRSHGFSGTGGGISHRQRSLKDGRTDGRTVENWPSIEGGGREIDRRNITEPLGGGGSRKFYSNEVWFLQNK